MAIIDQEIKMTGQDIEWVQLVVYDRPADHPDEVIVRPWFVGTSEPMWLNYYWSFESVESARRAIRRFRPHAICITRDSKDEPQIIETWW